VAETASVAETARSLAPILDTWPRAPSADDLILEFGADLMVENLSPRTIRNYLADLFALARHVGKPMDAVTTEDLQEYLRSQIASGLSVATRARHVGSVRRFYDWLRRTRHLPGSIAQDLRPIKRTKSLHRWWTTEQVAQFRTAFQTPEVLLTGRARGTEPRNYQLAEPRVVVARDRAMCELGLMGLRVSEVTNLDLADIVSLDDSDRATLLVKRKGRKDQALPIVGRCPHSPAAVASCPPARPCAIPVHPAAVPTGATGATPLRVCRSHTGGVC
jgi:site-specific recombinase XerD